MKGLDDKVAYRHATKAGNRGDVWKHAILFGVARRLIDQHQHRVQDGSPFLYAESHAGPGRYCLTKGGKWEKGIGSVCGASLTPDIAKLFSTDHEEYRGSWVMVRDLLQQMGCPGRMKLWETDPEAASAARSNASPQEKVCTSDGFVGVASANADLTLIDPPYRADDDWRAAGLLAQTLHSQGRSFLLWYHIAWPSKPQALVDFLGLPSHEALWAPFGEMPSQNSKGCGIIASGDVEHFLADLNLPQIAQSFHAKYVQRYPAPQART